MIENGTIPPLTAKAESDQVDRIDAILPQTQCTKCGYPACRQYAQAIAAGAADINQCPPGGAAGIAKLATLLGRTPKPLNPGNGIEKPRVVALIDESLCIGCTLCIQACPVDAIVGAPKFMHTVLTTLCSGCDLCVAPCPVDCIAMVPAQGDDIIWDTVRANDARQRFEKRNARLKAQSHAHARLLAEKRRSSAPDDDRKRALIQAAIERARIQRAGTAKQSGSVDNKSNGKA
jgi:electron transport complex protein RnfB